MQDGVGRAFTFYVIPNKVLMPEPSTLLLYIIANAMLQIVLYREKDVLSCTCEMPFVHSLLSKIPDDLPFELLITQAGDLFIQYPPNVLEHEASIQYQR